MSQERLTNCVKCHNGIMWNKVTLSEEVNGASAKTPVERGFCPNCGMVYRPPSFNFMLVAVNANGQTTVLSEGDNFSSVWTMIPVFKPIFESMQGFFTIQILNKGKKKKNNDILYIPIYEEQINTKPIEKNLH